LRRHTNPMVSRNQIRMRSMSWDRKTFGLKRVLLKRHSRLL
jgi:hypothetical protein